MKHMISLALLLVLCLSICNGCVVHRTNIGNADGAGLFKQDEDKVDGTLRQMTDAVKVGNHTLNAVELNYFYIDAVSSYVSNNYIYISFLIDTSSPLNEQYIDAEKKTTWADYFLTDAQSIMKNTYALYDAAVQAGHQLSDEEQQAIDDKIAACATQSEIYGYKTVKEYLEAVYGNGATEESYREYLRISAMASSYYDAYAAALEFSDGELKNIAAQAPYQYYSYTYASYYLGVNRFQEGTVDEDGNITYTDIEKDAAIEDCKKAADQLATGNYENMDDFNQAIQELDKKIDNKDFSTASATENEKVLYSKLNSLFRDWLIGKVEKEDAAEDAKDEDKYEFVERKEGDLAVIEYSSGSGDSKTVNGYYVLRFDSFTCNDFAMKNVRHLLVKFEGATYNGVTQTTSYSDAEKAAAKKEAEKLLADWVAAGNLSEDSFAALAKKESDDNADEGGLYENIYPGQMVDTFNDWCYDDNRKAGDYGIIETEYGYHIMYFVGDSNETYWHYLVNEEACSVHLSQWIEELESKTSVEILSSEYIRKATVYGVPIDYTQDKANSMVVGNVVTADSVNGMGTCIVVVEPKEYNP